MNVVFAHFQIMRVIRMLLYLKWWAEMPFCVDLFCILKTIYFNVLEFWSRAFNNNIQWFSTHFSNIHIQWQVYQPIDCKNCSYNIHIKLHPFYAYVLVCVCVCVGDDSCCCCCSYNIRSCLRYHEPQFQQINVKNEMYEWEASVNHLT